jgi:cellulose synthase/poly-beta-1,6-N-acetylglucosamine synthase-like glycosyltransferase
VKYYTKTNGGKGSALNLGIKKATGDLIITMDADSRFEKDAVLNMVRYFVDPSLDAAVGNVKVSNTKTLIGLLQQIEYTMGFYFKRTHAFFGSEYIIGGAFGAFRRNVFDRFGYFDEHNKTEDIEFSTRLQFYGCNIMFAEDAIAYTEGASTFIGLLKQRLRWKKGRFDTLIKYHQLFFSTQKGHRPFLTHFLLPVSMLYEVQLVLEPILSLFGLYYMFATNNFAALISWSLLTCLILFIGYTFGSSKNNKKVLLISPLYVFLYFVVNIAEMYAIFGSIKLLIQNKNVEWQRWQRLGVENA